MNKFDNEEVDPEMVKDISQGVCNITKSIIKDLIKSDKKGVEEYGVTVDREDYSLKEWLQHAYEETLDTAKYLAAAIKKLDNGSK
tara:strand:+ start:519 stop:773 length:255 start_codon:yes stop_codon:yes gene_type:complete